MADRHEQQTLSQSRGKVGETILNATVSVHFEFRILHFEIETKKNA